MSASFQASQAAIDTAVDAEAAVRATAITDAVSTHSADTTSVHGITDTAQLIKFTSASLAIDTIPSFNSNLQNLTGRPLMVNARVAIVAAPDTNGHIYLETTGLSPVSWQILDYLACRNETNPDTIGMGRGLVGIIPVDWFFRLRTQNITGVPSYVTDGAGSITYSTL